MTSTAAFYAHIQAELKDIEAAGLMKRERIMATPQGAVVKTTDGRELINLCANNYLGLSSHPKAVEAAHKALDTHGFGLSSVRFICGTQDIHKVLERRIAAFVGCEDAILYAAAFDANGGLFEPLLGEQDAIVSDALNHASIIDGIRLCKAQRYRYANNDLADLEKQLQEARAKGARHVLVFTDGVFSMDGTIARLKEIRELCDQYGALLGIDECHASGFLGKTGRGTPEHCGVFGQIDIVTGTFGKALGGASGGFTAARKEVVELLRQRSRPYLFSNTLAPAIVGASLAVLDLLEGSTELREPPGREHPLLARRAHRRRLRHQARQPPHRAGDGLRRRQGAAAQPAIAGAWRVRRGLLLPRGAQGPGAHSHAAQRRAQPRAAGTRTSPLSPKQAVKWG